MMLSLKRAAIFGICVHAVAWSSASAQQAASPARAGAYPLSEVLGRPFVPTSDVASLASTTVANPTSVDGGDGMSPANWGTSPEDPSLQSSIAQPNVNWHQDPPAVEPEPTAYELRKNQDKKSPSLPEILNKGRYFGAAEVLWMSPRFLGGTALTRTTGTSVAAEPFHFAYSYSPRFNFGFESEQGPGVEFEYWNFNDRSDIAQMTSDGLTAGQTSVYLLGPERWSRISADAAGETLSVVHELKAQSFDMVFFKEMEFKVSRINGFLGLHYATLTHLLRAQVTDALNAPISELLSQSEFEGFGPTIGIEYLRPVGHTKLEMLGGIKVSTLLGERNQLVQNSATLDFNRFGADELLSGLDGHIGVQYMHHLTEHRTIFARTTFEAQHWIGGGSPIDPTSDFGVYGMTFGVGVNR